MLTVTITKIKYSATYGSYEQQYYIEGCFFLISHWQRQEKKLSFETPEYVYVLDLLYLKICIEKAY